MQTHKRPRSPHLQIYRMPLTAGLMSITHRATGIFLSMGTLALFYWLMAIAQGAEAYQQAQYWLGSWFGLLVLFGWSIALFYHLFNGIRHLFWDAGLGFDLKIAKISGYLVLLATLFFTGITWGLAFLMKGDL